MVAPSIWDSVLHQQAKLTLWLFLHIFVLAHDKFAKRLYNW